MSDDTKAPEDGAARNARARLSESDSDLVRVIEDVVEILLGKGLITITDLPERAREKLAARRALRSRLPDLAQLIEPDADEDGV
ncbi:MAG: tryptophan synthase subunit beta [Alphaproteobacteria bacterium]